MFDDSTRWTEIAIYAVFFLVFYSGYLVRMLTHRTKMEKPENPYSWKCPKKGCTFEVSSNDKSTTDYIAAGHMKYEQSKQ